MQQLEVLHKHISLISSKQAVIVSAFLRRNLFNQLTKNTITVKSLLKNMHHLPGDKILLDIDMEGVIKYVGQLNVSAGSGINLYIHPDVVKAGYTISAGILLPFVKKALTSPVYLNRHKIIEVGLNTNKTMLIVMVKTVVDDEPVINVANRARFAVTHKLVISCI